MVNQALCKIGETYVPISKCPTFNKIQGCTITFILIPRLELTTATLSPKGSKILKDKLDIDDHDEEF